MDQQERDNWQKVLDSLEAAGDTESAFYVRARAICSGDPCLLYTSPSPRDRQKSRMPSSA